MPFSLGASSRAHLAGVHPALAGVVGRAILLTAQDFTVMEGLRSLAQQKENVRKGVSKTMDSKHLKQPDGYGHAVDLVPWVDGHAQWLWPAIYPIAAAMREAAIGAGVRLRWGGVWDRVLNDLPAGAVALEAEVQAYQHRHPGPDFLDGPHYELHA